MYKKTEKYSIDKFSYLLKDAKNLLFCVISDDGLEDSNRVFHFQVVKERREVTRVTTKGKKINLYGNFEVFYGVEYNSENGEIERLKNVETIDKGDYLLHMPEGWHMILQHSVDAIDISKALKNEQMLIDEDEEIF